MDRNVLNDIVNILCANIEKVHGVIKTHNIAVANRKSHNYAVQLLVKATNIPYSVELAKLMNLIINGKFTQRKMYYVSIDTAIFKLINNLTI